MVTSQTGERGRQQGAGTSEAVTPAKTLDGHFKGCLAGCVHGGKTGVQAHKRSTPNPVCRWRGSRVHLRMGHAYAALAMSEMKRSTASRSIIRRPPMRKLLISLAFISS